MRVDVLVCVRAPTGRDKRKSWQMVIWSLLSFVTAEQNKLAEIHLVLLWLLDLCASCLDPLTGSWSVSGLVFCLFAEHNPTTSIRPD